MHSTFPAVIPEVFIMKSIERDLYLFSLEVERKAGGNMKSWASHAPGAD